MDYIQELKKYGLTPETYEAVCKDIDAKIDGDLDIDWSELVEKYHLTLAPDTIRKASSNVPFGAKFRIDYLKNQMYLNPEDFTKERELDKKLQEIKKERIKLQTANVERSRLDRAQARQEMFYEYVGQVDSSLPCPEFHPLIFVPTDTDISQQHDYVVAISDIHYGAEFRSMNNYYSSDVVLDRFQRLAGKIIHFIKEKQLSKIYIANLGDTLQGILRISDLKLNDSSIVKSCVEICRIIAKFLNEISAYTNVEYYHVPTANHCQLRPLGTKANQISDEDLEYLISHYIADLCLCNERVTVYYADDNKPYIEIPVQGFDIVAMHGHQIKNMNTALQDLSSIGQKFVDYLMLGHFHSGKMITGTEKLGYDTEILIAPSFIGSDPYSDTLFKGGKSAVTIYGFNEMYGHDETYKIILN